MVNFHSCWLCRQNSFWGKVFNAVKYQTLVRYWRWWAGLRQDKDVECSCADIARTNDKPRSDHCRKESLHFLYLIIPLLITLITILIIVMINMSSSDEVGGVEGARDHLNWSGDEPWWPAIGFWATYLTTNQPTNYHNHLTSQSTNLSTYVPTYQPTKQPTYFSITILLFTLSYSHPHPRKKYICPADEIFLPTRNVIRVSKGFESAARLCAPIYGKLDVRVIWLIVKLLGTTITILPSCWEPPL